jgi:hypothetical protein
MLTQLPNRAAGINADPDFPSAHQLGTVIVQCLHGDVLKMLVAFFELAAACNNQSVLVDHGVTPFEILSLKRAPSS